MSNSDKTNSKYGHVRKILIITLSNIGDAVLTLPVLAHLSAFFPRTKITVLCGPKGVPVFIDDGRISELVIYDKRISLISKISLLGELRAQKFDLAVDLKNTLLPILLGIRCRTSFWRRPPRKVIHKRDVHLWKLKSLGLELNQYKEIKPLIWLDEPEMKYACDKVVAGDVKSVPQPEIAAMAPGAMSHLKRWPHEYFAELGSRLLRETDIEKIILLGSKDEVILCREVEKRINHSCCFSFAGQTTLKQAAAILIQCRFLVSNDSALMHIGSAVGIPVVALFGPTDENKYKPLSPGSQVVRKKLKCTPCEIALCRYNTHKCLQQLSSDEVFDTIVSNKLAKPRKIESKITGYIAEG